MKPWWNPDAEPDETELERPAALAVPTLYHLRTSPCRWCEMAGVREATDGLALVRCVGEREATRERLRELPDGAA